MRMFIALIVLASLSACSSPIVLRDPSTGQTALCQTGFSDTFFGVAGQKYANEQCAEAYARAGYVRMD